MGMFDYVELDNPMFGEDRGHKGQTKEFDNPYMENYEINEAGRLLYTEVKYEDRSDSKAEGILALAGGATPVPTGEITDMNWHGYLWGWGKGDYKWKCKFTDGNLISAEKVDMGD